MTATFARPITFGPESPLYRPPAHFLRGCLGRFATGVAVVSRWHEEVPGRHGELVHLGVH
jgi:hypothetical protein